VQLDIPDPRRKRYTAINDTEATRGASSSVAKKPWRRAVSLCSIKSAVFIPRHMFYRWNTIHR
jgi:hypothetical protein